MVVSKKSEVKSVTTEIIDSEIVEAIEDKQINDVSIAGQDIEVPYIAPESVVESTPVRPVTQFKYADSPFPETCTWLDAHGLDPENVGVGGISKGGYRNLMDEDRNWPFTAAEVDELWAIYDAELNAVDEEEGTVGE